MKSKAATNNKFVATLMETKSKTGQTMKPAAKEAGFHTAAKKKAK